MIKKSVDFGSRILKLVGLLIPVLIHQGNDGSLAYSFQGALAKSFQISQSNGQSISRVNLGGRGDCSFAPTAIAPGSGQIKLTYEDCPPDKSRINNYPVATVGYSSQENPRFWFHIPAYRTDRIESGEFHLRGDRSSRWKLSIKPVHSNPRIYCFNLPTTISLQANQAYQWKIMVRLKNSRELYEANGLIQLKQGSSGWYDRLNLAIQNDNNPELTQILNSQRLGILIKKDIKIDKSCLSGVKL